MRAPTPAQKQATTDLLGLPAEQRFEVRRKRGASLPASMGSPRVPVTTELAGSAPSPLPRQAHLPSPAALAVVAVMAAALLGLAFLGALSLVRAVFGQ